MLELAKECKNILAFTHVSTAYVNSNMPNNSVVEEKVYDLPGNHDPEQIVQDIVNLGPQRVAEQELAILGDYPNTYTFSKALAERAIKKNRGDLPVTILRPSIIICNYDEPFRGWIDSLAASGGLILGVSIGVLHFFCADSKAILDFVPCDFVSNQILVQTAYTAMEPTPNLNIIHSATTTKNPISILEVRDTTLKYSKYTPWYQNLARVWSTTIAKPQAWRLAVAVTETLPIALALLYANASGNEKLAKQLNVLSMVSEKMISVQTVFHHFIRNTWLF